MNGNYANWMFDREPAGTFAHGHIFIGAPDLAAARENPENGYWHCDIADHDSLTWSDKVYELFGLSAGTPISRDMAVACYAEHSKKALDEMRLAALRRDFGFILDAEINSGASSRWIRVLAVPILADGRVVGLHGVKKAL